MAWDDRMETVQSHFYKVKVKQEFKKKSDQTKFLFCIIKTFTISFTKFNTHSWKQGLIFCWNAATALLSHFKERQLILRPPKGKHNFSAKIPGFPYFTKSLLKGFPVVFCKNTSTPASSSIFKLKTFLSFWHVATGMQLQKQFLLFTCQQSTL